MIVPEGLNKEYSANSHPADSAGAIPVPRPSKRTLRIESLETRITPAVTAFLSAGTLTLVGSASADILTVTQTGTNLTVTGAFINQGGVMKPFVTVASVTKIYVTCGAGDDVVSLSGVSVKSVVSGGLGNDSVTGGTAADELYGRDGNDSLFGGGGNDKVFGEAGDDTLWGDDGNDTLYGSDGDDVLAGRAGNDLLYGDGGNDLLSGADGDDTIRGNIGDDSLFGGNGNDQIYGEDGNDSIEGNDDNDRLDGGTGDDTIVGGNGQDEIYGLAGNDSLNGGDGNDTIRAGTGSDKADGELGNDYMLGEEGDDTLHGGQGNDMIAGGAGSDFVYGDDGNDVVSANVFGEIVNGGLGDDTLSGGPGDVIIGGGGDDTIVSGGGTDTGSGGGGGGGGGGSSGGTGTVFQTVRSQWAEGSTNDITVRNTSTSNINGWKVEFDADFEITEIWNARIVSHDGNRYTISNIPGFWNTIIKPNTQIVFGFNARLESGDSTAFTNIELNDKVLSTTPTPPTPTPGTKGTVVQAIRGQWVDGTTNDLAIRNTGTTNISGWTITFVADFEVTDVWNALLISKLGNVYTIKNIPGFWNAVIKPNTEIKIGFNTKFDVGDSLNIRTVTLNGNPV